jgi:DNA-binding transcriptional regulator YhcF (GntR family)
MTTPRRRRADRDPSYRPLAKQLPTQEDVARRAYQLFEQRGNEAGHDWEDWFQAERELIDIRTKREKQRKGDE